MKIIIYYKFYIPYHIYYISNNIFYIINYICNTKYKQLYIIKKTLFIIYYMLYIIYIILYNIYFIFDLTYDILYIIYYTLYTIQSIYYILYYRFYLIYCILCILIIYIRYQIFAEPTAQRRVRSRATQQLSSLQLSNLAVCCQINVVYLFKIEDILSWGAENGKNQTPWSPFALGSNSGEALGGLHNSILGGFGRPRWPPRRHSQPPRCMFWVHEPPRTHFDGHLTPF